MSVKEITKNAIQSLEDFQGKVKKSLETLKINTPQSTTTQVVVSSAPKGNIVPTLVVGGLCLVGGTLLKSETNRMLPTILQVAGVSAMAFGLYKNFNSNAQPLVDTPSTETFNWDNTKAEISNQFNKILNFKEDFRSLLNENKDKIQSSIDESISDFQKKQTLEDLSFHRAVPAISISDYIIDINKISEHKNIQEVNALVFRFKNDVLQSLNSAIQEQKQKYQEIENNA